MKHQWRQRHHSERSSDPLELAYGRKEENHLLMSTSNLVIYSWSLWNGERGTHNPIPNVVSRCDRRPVRSRSFTNLDRTMYHLHRDARTVFTTSQVKETSLSSLPILFNLTGTFKLRALGSWRDSVLSQILQSSFTRSVFFRLYTLSQMCISWTSKLWPRAYDWSSASTGTEPTILFGLGL